jgi:GTPase SAR1 family protein
MVFFDIGSDKMIKLLLIGNSGVGKSSILMRFSDNKFVHNYYNTIGVDYVFYSLLRRSSI